MDTPTRRAPRRRSGAKLPVALLMAAVLVLAACGGATESGRDPGGKTQLTVIHGSGPSLIPLFFQSIIAIEMGFWEEEGIAVEQIGLGEGSASSTQQLVAGNGDIADPSPQTVFDSIEEGYGDQVRIIGTWLYEQPFSIRTFPDSGIDSVDDLAGKVIGVSNPSGGEVPLLEATLELYGVEDYELLPIGDGSAQTINALQSRSVDAYSTSAKDFLGIVDDVELVRVSVPEWQDLTANIFVARTDYLSDNRDAVVGYLRGLAKASLFAYENLDAAIEITAEYQEEGIPDYLVEGWVEQTRDQSVSAELIEEGQPFRPAAAQLQAFLDFYQDAGAIAEDVDVDLDRYIDESIANDAGNFDPAAIRQLARDYNAGG